jgi:hypothetical protein
MGLKLRGTIFVEGNVFFWTRNHVIWLIVTNISDEYGGTIFRIEE